MTDDIILIDDDDKDTLAENSVAVGESVGADDANDGTLGNNEVATTTTTRGRPRPEEVVNRDEFVYTSLIGSMTRQALAASIEMKPSHVYLSLIRLRAAGRVQHEYVSNVGHVWSRIASAL